ncbi:hypothetical protein IE53DRAFT_388917 [Violaceomyces palustris]|uniref:Uncharacterized protein n=1 Tax=Violaceomyces palustris TaxID=1673888 RepID=A0ACD0NT07_9BASI|nr:hypothetical protein IE53DRAFT_388917 [Violaceomyces palustris]
MVKISVIWLISGEVDGVFAFPASLTFPRSLSLIEATSILSSHHGEGKASYPPKSCQEWHNPSSLHISVISVGTDATAQGEKRKKRGGSSSWESK